VFYNPTLQKFSTSANYLLDSNKSIGSAFPSLHYDGGLHIRLYSDPKEDTLEPYPIGSPVFAQLSTTADGDEMIAPGTMVQIPSDSDGEEFYPIRLDENQTLIPCDRSQLQSPDEPILSGTEDSASYAPESPEWCRVGVKVTLLVGNKYYKGALDLDEDQDWIFTVRDRNGKVVMEYTLVDLPYTWNTRLVEGTLVVGHEDAAECIIRDAFHVSAEWLQSKSPPSTLKKALVTGNPDAPIWDESYNEEYDGLTKLDTFKVLTKAQYDALPNRPKAIPMMCVLTVKVDKWHRPVRAKAHIAVLGNLEDRAWTKADCYAPVLRQDSLRLLISIAVQVGCVAKQGDCKHAFCQP
jgi:hypothetical protein